MWGSWRTLLGEVCFSFLSFFFPLLLGGEWGLGGKEGGRADLGVGLSAEASNAVAAKGR